MGMRPYNVYHLVLGLIMATAFSADASAQSNEPTISTDRPSFSDGPGIVPEGRPQIESGYTYAKTRNTETHAFGELLLRLPFSEALELRVMNGTYAHVTQDVGSGFLDPTVGGKWKIMSADKDVVDAALVAQMTLPVGNVKFRNDTPQPTFKFAWSAPVSSATGIGGNFNYSLLGDGDTRFSQFAPSLYVAQALSDLIGTFLEFYALLPNGKDGPNGTYCDTGISYLLTKRIQLDARIGTGFNEGRDGWFTGVGISYGV